MSNFEGHLERPSVSIVLIHFQLLATGVPSEERLLCYVEEDIVELRGRRLHIRLNLIQYDRDEG